MDEQGSEKGFVGGAGVSAFVPVRHCASCSSGDFRPLQVASPLPTGAMAEPEWVRCQECGLVFLNARPSISEILSSYPHDYPPYRRPVQEQRSALMRWARRRSLDRRKRVVERAWSRPPARLLDVGCSTGIFLDHMRAQGWQVHGVELNPEPARAARQHFGLEIYVGQIQDAGFPSGSFEVLTFWDVLEHTLDPLATLSEASRVLVEEGLLFLTLPHWESLDRRLFRMAWIGYDAPRHLFAFPRPTLRGLLRRSGFEVLTARCGLGGYFTFLASLRRLWTGMGSVSPAGGVLLKLLELPGARLPFAPFFSILDAVGLGGTLLVVARKGGRADDPR